jgi:GntR family transcriptional regulator
MQPPIDETLAKIRLDPKAEIPLYVQLKNQLRYLIQAGHLAFGQLPTVRQLALDVNLNPNTVARVYRELEAEGLLEKRRGVGTFISGEASGSVDEKLALLRTTAEYLLSEGKTPDELRRVLDEAVAEFGNRKR